MATTPLSRTKTFDESGSPARMSSAATATAARRTSGHEPNFRGPSEAKRGREDRESCDAAAKRKEEDVFLERERSGEKEREREGTRARSTSTRHVFATKPSARECSILNSGRTRGQTYCAKRTL